MPLYPTNILYPHSNIADNVSISPIALKYIIQS
jgi:hypothetical protein